MKPLRGKGRVKAKPIHKMATKTRKEKVVVSSVGSKDISRKIVDSIRRIKQRSLLQKKIL